MVDFAALRGNAKSGVDAANDLAKQMGQKKDYTDERLWKHTWNSNNVSENVIRFLPVSFIDMERLEKGEIEHTAPIVTIKKHFFKCAKGFYVENSLSTFGEDCPIIAHDAELWKQWKNEGKPDDARKRTLMNRISNDEVYCNILVVNDKQVPENNGKVFLYKLGKSIYEKIVNAANPKFEGVTPFDAFNLFTGANLNLMLSGKETKGAFGNYIKPNFDEVKWQNPAALFDDDAMMEKVWKEEYSLTEMIDRKHFKTYEDLEQAFFKKMGYGGEAKSTPTSGAQTKNLADYQSNKESVSEPQPTNIEDGNKGGGIAANVTDHVQKTDKVDAQEPVNKPDASTGDDLSDFEKLLQQG